MKNILLITLIAFCSAFTLNSQIADGSIAPDFTVTDINGNVHNLYNYLNAGKHVVLDFSATWCGPCWSYHNSGVLESLWDNHGPSGSNKIMVFFVEADLNTNLACLYGPTGCLGGTQGNWVANTGYPILNLTSTNGGNVANNYQIGYYPTLFAINANDKRVFEVGQQGVSTWESWLFESFKMSYTSTFQNSVPCAGTGQVGLNVTNGAGSKFYNWNNGATTATISNLFAGTYQCEISDANGYFMETPNYVVGGPPNIVIQTLNHQNNTCGGDGNGFIEINGTGGNGGFSYFWSNGSGSNLINSLYAGIYSVTVTDSYGCEAYKTYTITEPPILLGTSTTIDPTCGQSNGSVTIAANGGAGPYLFEMNGTSQSNPTFNNLLSGIYPYSINDNNGCIFTSNVTLTSSVSPTAITASIGEVSCINLSAQVSGAGSSAGSNYTYLWTTSDGTIQSGATNLVATVIDGGTYNLLVTNTSNNCTKSSNTVVFSNNAKPSLVIADPSELNCVTSEVVIDGSNSSTGSNFTYAWTTTNGNIVSGAETLNPTVDDSGDYKLLITDTTNGCSKQGETSVVENISVPTLSIPQSTITCENEVVNLCANTNAVSVLWNVPENNNNNCILVNEGGSYSVTATGANGCTSTASSTVEEDLTLPEISVATPNVLTCLVDEITINGDIEGDAANFTFAWSTVVGSIDSGVNTLDPVVSLPGLYTLEAVNSNSGCTATLEVEIAEIVMAPSAVFAGTLTMTGLNGVASEIASTTEYNWDFGNGSTSSNANASVVYTESGIYNVCLTVSNDCGENVTCQEFTFSMAFSVTSVIENISCHSQNDGQIEILTSGGLAPFTAVWSGPNGFTSDKFLIKNLASGQYSVTVTDSDNNSFDQQYTITEPTALSSSNLNIVHDTNNQSQGSININFAGGTNPLKYLWTNGQTTQNISSLPAGSYSCKVTDGNDCEKTFGPFVVQNTSGVDELKYLSQFIVYPNPTSAFLNYEIEFLKSTSSKVKIINNLGRVIATRSYSNNISDNVDVSNLSPGIYFLSVSNQDFNIVRKFVILR